MISVISLVSMLLLCGCGSTVANDYKMVFTTGDSGKLDYINVVDSEFVLYSVDGVVTVTVDGEVLMLESAIVEGKLSVAELMESIRSDASDGDVEYIEYPNGSVEYRYDEITVVDFNYNGFHEIYFGNTQLTYYTVAH